MKTIEELDELLKSLESDGWTVEKADDGTRVITAGDKTMSFYLGVKGQPRLYVRGKIGKLPKTDVPVELLEDLLAANFFWRETAGGVLSLRDGDVYLTGRCDVAGSFEPEFFREYVAYCVRQADIWQRRLALAEVKA